MIYAIYIAAAAVVGVLIGFVVLSVTWLKKTVAKNIRSKTTELISVYDDLLEEKSRELAALEAKQATIPQQSVSSREPETAQAEAVAATLPASEMLGMAERSGGAVYRRHRWQDVFEDPGEFLLPDGGAAGGSFRCAEGTEQRGWAAAGAAGL